MYGYCNSKYVVQRFSIDRSNSYRRGVRETEFQFSLRTQPVQVLPGTVL